MSSELLEGNHTKLKLPPALRVRRTLKADPGWRFTSLAFSPDGQRLAVGLQNGHGLEPDQRRIEGGERDEDLGLQVKIIGVDGESCAVLDTVKDVADRHHGFGIIPLAWDITGNRLAAGTNGGLVLAWDVSASNIGGRVATKEPPNEPLLPQWQRPLNTEHRANHTADRKEIVRYGRSIYAIAWSPDGKQLAVSGSGEGLSLLDASSGTTTARVRVFKEGSACLIWAPLSKILSGSFDGPIKMWETEELRGENERDFHGIEIGQHKNGLDCLALWLEHGRLLSGGRDRTIRVWDTESARQVGLVEGLQSPPRALSVNRRGSWFAAHGADAQVWLFNSESLERLAEFRATPPMPLYSISVCPTAPLLAVLVDDRRAIAILDVDESLLLKTRLRRATTRYANAKVVLVGDTGVGKTGMALRLRGKRWRETDSTHGRKVHLLESTEDKTDPHGPIRRDVLLWDLAGQSDYRLTHQLHLDMATVALVLFDGRDPKQPLGAPEYWSHALSLARVQDPVVKLLVAAREDRTGVGLPERVLEDFCKRHGFDKWFRTSAKKNWGIDELRKLALEKIDWKKLPIITSTGWLEAVRAQVEKCRRCKKSGMIQSVGSLYKEFNRKRSNKCPLQEFIGCLERLDGADVVRLLVFQRAGAPTREETLVLMEPEYVDAYASGIVNAAKNDPGGIGSLPEKEVLAGEFVMDEDERLSNKAEEKELLRYVVGFLLDHELAVRDEERPGDPEARGFSYLVFPSLYTAEMPFPDKIKKAVWWRFNGAVRNFFTVLLARLARHREFSLPEYWRDAARFAHAQGGKVIVLLKEKGTGTAELALGFEGEVKKAVQEALGHFVDGLFEDPKFQTNYTKWQTQQCVNCGHEMDHDAAVARLMRGEKDIICATCGMHQPFWDFPDHQSREGIVELARLHADAEAGTQRDVAATVVAGLEADKKHDVLISYSRSDSMLVLRLAEALKNLGIRPWLDVWEIVPGERWQPQLQAALKRIRRALVCIGPKGTGPWQDLEMDVLLKKAVKQNDRVIPVALPGAPGKLKMDPFWEQLQSVDLREWEKPGDVGLNTLVGAIFGESPGKMRGIHVDAPWVAQRRRELQVPRRDATKPCQVTLTFHADLAVEKKSAVEAVRAQIAERLNIPSESVRVLGEPVKGSVKFTMEFEHADDAARLLAQVQAGNENILSLFHRWSARREEFLAENKGIHFHGPAEIHGPVAVGEGLTQTVTITKEDATLALTKIEGLVAKYVQDAKDLAEARKHLGGAQAELDEEKPDHERVAKRTGRVVEILKKVGEGAHWFNHVVECGKTVAEFCGKHGPLVIQALGMVVGS